MSLRHKFVWTGCGILLVALAQTGSIVWAQSPALLGQRGRGPAAGAPSMPTPTRSGCSSAARPSSTSARRSRASR